MKPMRWLALPAILLLAACGSGGGTPSSPAVAGTWSAATTLTACTAAELDLRLSLEQSGDLLTGYAMLTMPGIGYELLASFDGTVSSAGKVTAAVRFAPGLLGARRLTANLTLVDERLVGTITSDELQHCGADAPRKMTMVVDLPRTASSYTAPPALPDLSGEWTDTTTSVSECGTVSPVSVTVELEQDEFGSLRGVAQIDTAADLPRYTLLTGYLLPQGAGGLMIDAGSWDGDVLLELRDDGVLNARFQYSPFDCGGVPHSKVVEAELAR